MEYEWDSNKATTNLQKHGIDFADAAMALEDERAITIKDDSTDEERFSTIGMDVLGRVVVVIYTWRGSAIRIISARKATARERREYESAL